VTTDSEVRERALDPETSFLVEAPAGSGKTELLIQRYLRLLATVEQPESIVALTFTRKAAAEMKERVLSALREAVEKTPADSEWARTTRALAEAALARAAVLDWHLLEDSRRLQIGTIDSFSSLLTHQMPLLARFGSNPEVIEFATDLYRTAARRAIIALAEHPDFQTIFREITVHFDGDLTRLEKLIAALLGKRDQWDRRLDGGAGDSLRDEIDSLLEEEIFERQVAAFSVWPPGIPGRPAVALAAVPEWQARAEELLTKEGTPRKRCRHASTLEANPEFCDTLHGAREPIPAFLRDQEWRLISNFAAVLGVALIKLEDVFRERGQVDFTRISQAAVDALGTADQPTELAFRLDFRIEHLLVDEFQDTSLIQYDLINRLTAQWSPGDGRTLFLVGDPLQSIYRFRDAEVALFLQAATRGIGSLPLETLRLTRNFRSKPAIVKWVNDTFERIAPPHDDPERGEVALRPAVAARTERGPAPELHCFVDDDEGCAEAAKVVKLARAAIKNPSSSVAILVRTRNHLAAILPALRDAGIPYEAVDLDALTNEQHILDLLSLSRAIHHIADRVSWLACLRAPFCGLGLHDLAALVEGEPRAPIVELLSDDARLLRLSADGRARVHKIRSALKPALANFGRYPIRQLVESVWIALGGPAALMQDSQREDAASFFSLLEAGDEGGSISDFSLFEARLEFLYARPRRNAGGYVQVMTIHKAKGLQFDTVILPHLQGKARANDRDLLVWANRLDRKGVERFLIAGLPQSGTDKAYYNFVDGQRGEKEKAEERRLLYVAVTRAKNVLHLLGNVDSRKDEGVCKASGGFLHALWNEEVEQQFIQEKLRLTKSRPAQQTLLLTAEPATKLRRLPATWVFPVPEPSIPWVPAYRAETASAEEPRYEWVSETGRHVGTIVHDMLRRIAEEGVHSWKAADLDRLKPFADRELHRLGVTASERPAGVGRILRAVNSAISSERGRWILSPHAQAQCEWALGGLLGERLESARIDRTFVDERGVRWIIDYKTSSHEGGAREVFLNEEKRRYLPQLETYARLLQQFGESAVSVGLYFPLLDEWIAWEVSAEQSLVLSR
jgi:ATP-dependent helicase/nuclease subunit A